MIVSKPSSRRRRVAGWSRLHGVPGNRAGQYICQQSSSMALAIQNLIRAAPLSLLRLALFPLARRAIVAANPRRGACLAGGGRPRTATPRATARWWQSAFLPAGVGGTVLVVG